MLLFPAMVTLVWGKGGSRGGRGDAPPCGTAHAYPGSNPFRPLLSQAPESTLHPRRRTPPHSLQKGDPRSQHQRLDWQWQGLENSVARRQRLPITRLRPSPLPPPPQPPYRPSPRHDPGALAPAARPTRDPACGTAEGGLRGTHTHDYKTNEHHAAQNVRFLVRWIVKQEACSTPTGAFLQHRTRRATS